MNGISQVPDSVTARINDIEKLLREEQNIQTELDAERHKKELKYAEELLQHKKDLLFKQQTFELDLEQKTRKRLITLGLDASEEQMKRVKDAQAKIDAATSKKDKKELKKKYENELKEYRIFVQEKAKLDKQLSKEVANAVKANQKEGSLGAYTSFFSSDARNSAATAIQEAYADAGITLSSKQAAALAKAGQLDQVAKALSNFAQQLNGTVNEISNYKGSIDTRLQGLRMGTGLFGSSFGLNKSYWDRINADVTEAVGLSPFIKQSEVNSNIAKFVSQGIAFDVEQRAFLQTISDRIATTFNATDSTLLRLVRIQQQDTTAARLGMESALTAFLNNMYETSEYMTDVANSVRSSLLEAEAMMGAKSAAAFEYQVQKWMGSMYSVGMSQNSVQGIANVLGQIAAGQIDSLNGQGAGNLVIMAANNSGMSIADILSNGLNDNEANLLMSSMVDYLADIYEETKGNNVVQQQYAKVFGLTAADLKAASSANLSNKNIYGNSLNYGGMMSQLADMYSTIYKRTSMGSMLGTIFDNFKYTTAAGIASDPVLYGLYNVASMLKDTVGGIAIPSISVMGNSFDLETTVADLMNVGALSGGLLGGTAKMLAGLAKGGTALSRFGINTNEGPNVVSRGTGATLLSTSGEGLSGSGYIGNASASDVKSKTIGDASSEAEAQKVEQQENSNEITIKDVNENVVMIYRLLEAVTNGSANFYVTPREGSIWSNTLGGGY